MPRIRLTASALSDLSEIWHYIAAEQQSPLNADSLADDFDERFQLIALHPHIPHLRTEDSTSPMGQRKYPRIDRFFETDAWV